MKLGKRERLARREQMRWRQICRNRHQAVMRPAADSAACSNAHIGKSTASCSRLTVPESRKPRVDPVWSVNKARSFAQRGSKVYS